MNRDRAFAAKIMGPGCSDLTAAAKFFGMAAALKTLEAKELLELQAAANELAAKADALHRKLLWEAA